MRRFTRTLLLPLVVFLSGCSDWLTTEPQTILTDQQTWQDPKLVTAVLANFYNRMPQHVDFGGGNACGSLVDYCGWYEQSAYDEAMWSGIQNAFGEHHNQMATYEYGRWRLWNYDLIRDMNVAIDNLKQGGQSSSMLVSERRGFLAELRFLRAFNYLDLVKRMGGVPLITEQLVYDFKGDASSLQHPRNKESEVYDFVASEMDAIADSLGNAGSQTRANKWTALAVKSRAMLYAGSIARFNNEAASPITLPGGEVGIAADKAVDYFTKSLDASRKIITQGPYTLYKNNADPAQNFYETVSKKTGNNEVILARDYSAGGGYTHWFTVEIIPPSQVVDRQAVSAGAALSPSLNLVEAFDYKDGSAGTMRGVGDGTVAGQANWIFYNKPEDIFAEKDPRLWGTIVYPGAQLAGKTVSMQAGLYVWNAGTNRYDKRTGEPGSKYTDGSVLTAVDGPVPSTSFNSSTGFYLRKYFDTNPAAATTSTGSDMWWVEFRLAEIYLNAAEAAFELGLTGEALGYVNALRTRAGVAPLAALTRDKIRNERRVELAFEDHRVWDLKRWRTAHIVWDGNKQTPSANVYALFPYRVVRPGSPQDGKWVYDKFISSRNTVPRYFRPGNYYSEIQTSILNNNPKIIKNPFH